MTEQKEKGWFRKALDKYDKFCDELGINQGTCRGCVPIVKFDPEPEKKVKRADRQDEKSANSK